MEQIVLGAIIEVLFMDVELELYIAHLFKTALSAYRGARLPGAAKFMPLSNRESTRLLKSAKLPTVLTLRFNHRIHAGVVCNNCNSYNSNNCANIFRMTRIAAGIRVIEAFRITHLMALGQRILTSA